MLKTALILKTNINVSLIREYLFKTKAMQQPPKEETKGETPISPSKPGTAGSKNFERVLSTKAIQLGTEHGITAEFICQ